MEEVLEAVKGLASWDAWAKLITASRASPLARSHALASFNYDEVVVMDGFLEVRFIRESYPITWLYSFYQKKRMKTKSVPSSAFFKKTLFIFFLIIGGTSILL